MPRRPNKLTAFGLIDTFVGLLLVALAAATFGQAFQTLDRLSIRQESRAQTLLEVADGSVLDAAL
jgi:hypothetical protein